MNHLIESELEKQRLNNRPNYRLYFLQVNTGRKPNAFESILLDNKLLFWCDYNQCLVSPVLYPRNNKA